MIGNGMDARDTALESPKSTIINFNISSKIVRSLSFKNGQTFFEEKKKKT